MATFAAVPFLGAKLGSTAILLVITAFFSYLPFLIKHRVRRSGLIMSYCNCMAGGIVLGALLMHMVPEIMEAGHCHDHSAHGLALHASSSPVAGLDAILPIDPHTAHKHGPGCDHKHDHNHSHKHDHDDHKHGKAVSAASKQADDHSHDHPYPWGPFFAGVSFLILFAVDRLFLTHSHCADAHPPTKAVVEKSACSHAHHGQDHHHHHHEMSIQPDNEHGSCHEDDVIGGCHSDGINASSTKAQTFVFVLALSIHSFLEGLGMATKNTSSSLVSFLISLFAHKWLEAFALGAGVAKACFSTAHSFCLIVIYALLTPVGIFLGMFLESLASDKLSLFNQYIVRQALDGLAIGSFLFVSCIEMIPSEFHKKNKHTPYKYVLLTLGFISMAIIARFHTH
jgi:zinc transporter 1/2/3